MYGCSGEKVKFPCILCFQVLEEINKWTFDVFKLHDITQGHPLLAVTYTILQVITVFITCFIMNYIGLDFKTCAYSSGFPINHTKQTL